ncbi:unnamed protein product [Ilex paraguariensis]|uniref:DUF4228 domain protein n=1 Tax=Ilex paraguariensis TaxID=185542 RepID=A0ABC8QKZ9_9AQUA
MGIKVFGHQMLPWCFHLMTNHISCLQFQPKPSPVGGTIKLINSNGRVKIYDRPIHVSDLMVEFPKHMVCRSDSLYIGKKISALSEDDHLRLGHTYFLLPRHYFQSVLSFVTIASFASSSQTQSQPASSLCKNAFLKKAAANCQPFHIEKSPSGCLRVRISEEFISKLMEEGKISEEEEEEEENCSGKSKSRVCTTPQLQKDYVQLVGSRLWRPKLETIRETREKRKLSSFGLKRRKRSQSIVVAQKTQKSKHRLHHHISSSISHAKTLSKDKMIKTTCKSV